MISPTLSTLILLAFMVEFLTETVRENCPYADRIPAGIVSTMFGILLCYLTGAGILDMLGNSIHYPIIDYLITGLIISRGSGVVHDFISALTGFARSYARRYSRSPADQAPKQFPYGEAPHIQMPPTRNQTCLPLPGWIVPVS